MQRRPRSPLLLLGLVLALGGVTLALRLQPAVEGKLLRRKLALDLAPDESVKAARALAALDPGVADFDRLGEEGKLRFVLAVGYVLADAPAPATVTGGPVGAAEGALARVVEEREGASAHLLASLTAAHEPVALRFLAEAGDPAIRRRAAQAIGRGGDRAGLDALRGRFVDPEAAVRVAALRAGLLLAARLADPAARVAFLADAARVPSLARPAVEAASAGHDPAAVPVLIAFLGCPGATDVERHAAVEAIRRVVGPERAAGAPKELEPATWEAWWAKASTGTAVAPPTR
jgi:hypothetical protein